MSHQYVLSAVRPQFEKLTFQFTAAERGLIKAARQTVFDNVRLKYLQFNLPNARTFQTHLPHSRQFLLETLNMEVKNIISITTDRTVYVLSHFFFFASLSSFYMQKLCKIRFFWDV